MTLLEVRKHACACTKLLLFWA